MHFYKQKVALNQWYAKFLALSENLSTANKASDLQHSLHVARSPPGAITSSQLVHCVLKLWTE